MLIVYFEGHRAKPLTGFTDVRQNGGLPGPPPVVFYPQVRGVIEVSWASACDESLNVPGSAIYWEEIKNHVITGYCAFNFDIVFGTKTIWYRIFAIYL